MAWIMVDGLAEEHLALLRFGAGWGRSPPPERTSLERATCFGKAWGFNLFSLRPAPSLGFLSQATGSKNVDGSCGDFARDPVWGVFRRIGYRTVVLESGVPDGSSLARARSCGGGADGFLADAALVRMAPGGDGGGGGFHHQSVGPLRAGEVLHDRACREDGCFSGFAENARAVWRALGPGGPSILVARVGDYAAALEARDAAGARRVLAEIDGLVGFLMAEPGAFVLVTSSGARGLELPAEGPDWGPAGRDGRGVLYRRRSLMSPVWAQGPGAENFCGVYEESEVFNRILWRPRRPFLERLLVPDP